MKRPVLYWVVLFVLGELLYSKIPMAWNVLLITVYIAYVIFGNISYIRNNRRLLAYGVIFMLFGFVCTGYWRGKNELCRFDKGERIYFSGIITEIEEGETPVYRIRLSRVNYYKISAYMIMEFDGDVEEGAAIEGLGEVEDFSVSTNPGQFCERDYECSKGNLLKINNVHITGYCQAVIPVRHILSGIKSHISGIYDTYLNEQDASLAKAMVLGDKRGIDPDIKLLYRRNGIAHLIAISGLHIAMLGGTLYLCLRRLVGYFIPAAVVGISFILMYGMLTGLSGATFRAVIMLIVSIGADVSGRRYDAVTSLALALMVMLVANPGQVVQAGFLLSFTAVTGIACVYPVLAGMVSAAGKYKILDGFIISISVQLTIIPVLLYFFYELPVYGVLLNVLVVPLMSILLAALIIVGIIGTIVPYAAVLLSKAVGLIYDFYELLCRLSEQMPCHTICTGRPSFVWIAAYYIVLAGLLLCIHKRRYNKAAGICLLWVMMWVSFIIPSRLTVCMFDVGQGDGIFIRTPYKQNIIIDGGSSSKKKVGQYILADGIRYYGAGKLDYVIVTHSDADHYSGISELLDDQEIVIEHFVLPAITNPDKAYIKLQRKAEQRGCEVHYLKAGDRIYVDDVYFLCLNPEMQDYADKNEGSIVLWMKYKRFDMLFTGDIDGEVERKLLNNRILRECIRAGDGMDVLKTAHHGSATASSRDFLKSMSFDTALVSVGKNNRYGHPAQDVIDRLHQFCKYIYLTKDSGAITIDTDGKAYTIQEFKSHENNNAGY